MSTPSNTAAIVTGYYSPNAWPDLQYTDFQALACSSTVLSNKNNNMDQKEFSCYRFGMVLCNIGARFYLLYFATTLAVAPSYFRHSSVHSSSNSNSNSPCATTAVVPEEGAALSSPSKKRKYCGLAATAATTSTTTTSPKK
eukprot:3405670-Rhodomonas_salina.1